MKTPRVTIDEVMAWHPCDPPYTREHVQKLFDRRKYMTAEQILDLDIPYEDRLWAVLREELIDARTLREFACDCAERALKREEKRGRTVDPRSWKAIEVARRYARGEATDEELAAAGDAAGDAAGSAARFAARFAARSAARSAAWAAAWFAAEFAAGSAAWVAAGAAAGAAARDAARAAAWDAARDAERRWQVKHLRKMLEES